MGGVRVDEAMAARVPGLYAAGEAVGGGNGANRLSGNAVTEALVFGRRAGRSAAARAATMAAPPWSEAGAAKAATRFRVGARAPTLNVAAGIAELQALMSADAGPFRTGTKLANALDRLRDLRIGLGAHPPPVGRAHDAELLDWLDLDGMLQTAEAIVAPALSRAESRGAHQREDHPGMEPSWRVNQVLSLDRVRLAEGCAAALTTSRQEVAA